MASRPWKKAIAAAELLAGLRSKGNGSLVVQTGFPTSVADLIVKNHGRLKKASRTKKKNFSPTPDLSAAGSDGAATRFPADGCRSDVDTGVGKSTSNGRIAERWPRFRLLAGTLIILVVLLIGKKKLVLWITVSAFSLAFLEICGRLLNPCLKARNKLDSAVGMESASPIEQINLGFLATLPVANTKSEESDAKKGKSKSSSKSDAKKLRWKFMLNKSNGIGAVGTIPHCVQDTGEELSEKDSLGKGDDEDDDVEEDVGSFKISFGDGDGDKLHKYFQFVLFLIVLCGLVKGKTVAVVLALAWCFLLRFITGMMKGKMT